MLRFILARLPTGLKESIFKADGYGRLGLLTDDCYVEHPLMEEAVRRLPKQIQDERNFRRIRAIQLSLTHTLLPESQWIKFEDDHNYLEPYIQEVMAEGAEKKEWYNTH